MIVEIHAPKLDIETWEITSLAVTDSDASVLDAAVDNVAGSRLLTTQTVDSGARRVVSRRTAGDDLVEAGRLIAEARAVQDRAIEFARRAAETAIADGASEREVTRTLGVDRNRLRAMLGKPRR